MTKRQLAQKRNYFKYQLLGTKFEISGDPDALNAEEFDLLIELCVIKQRLIDLFDYNSREMGLRVPEFKCWCGKEGKYLSSERTRQLGYEKVCKKHLDDD